MTATAEALRQLVHRQQTLASEAQLKFVLGVLADEDCGLDCFHVHYHVDDVAGLVHLDSHFKHVFFVHAHKSKPSIELILNESKDLGKKLEFIAGVVSKEMPMHFLGLNVMA